jgi:SWI/SNF-related matrix-associated actin-dependent regulator of chromatin subfamily A-like protein 1
MDRGEAVLRFPYDERLRQLLRAIPGRRWDPVGRAWCLPLDPPDRAEALARLLEGMPDESQVSEELTRTIARRRARRHRGECLVDLARPDAHWWLGFATDTAPDLVSALLEHPRAHSLPAIGRALVPLDDDAARTIDVLQERSECLRLSHAARRALLAHHRRAAGERREARARAARAPARSTDPFSVDALDALMAEQEARLGEADISRREGDERHAREAEMVALSAATEGTLKVPGLGGELKPFQRAGVSYLLAQRRAFLADEQGLGKTIEALATLEADRAYPTVVVCPASLKLNWLREIRRWLPHRSARALVGTGRGSDPRGRAEVTVVNYDIVASRLAELCALSPRALVLDESHYCKNAKAKRTKAVHQLATSVPREGLVLALTGTPVMNHPKELISQLRILGRLGEFGSGMRFARDFHGPGAHQRLHWHLRARCFARRLKRDVLPQLPPKTRAVVPVELDNEPEYRLAERDLVAWLQSQPLDLDELDSKVAAALRAERLVRLNALKLLAARGKLHAALAWIHDFCTSGERLVVFAHHREIQRAVLERFPGALHILGEDGHAARDASWRAFQAPDGDGNQLLVCSIEVAGQGVTLTRSSNVVFLELDWTPAKHEQAEDRCHRIGQQDAVNATYLLAAGTIDETIAALLERKRVVIGAVTDGRPEDEEGVVDALVRELRGTPYRHLRAVA